VTPHPSMPPPPPPPTPPRSEVAGDPAPRPVTSAPFPCGPLSPSPWTPTQRLTESVQKPPPPPPPPPPTPTTTETRDGGKGRPR